MKLSTIFKIIFAVTAIVILVWFAISEIQFQQMKNESLKSFWLKDEIAKLG
jgi:hypothetical protein